MDNQEVAWLVEAPGHNYLGARNIAHYPDFYWTNDANKALRFWSREQADLTAMAVRRLVPELWAFAATLGEAWPREHKWFAKSDVEAARAETRDLAQEWNDAAARDGPDPQNGKPDQWLA